jgi:transcriptional regulator of acetoin/glycerol metabolism
LQSALLGVLQDGRVRPLGAARERVARFRLVAATRHPLDVLARDGRLRADLLYRIDVLTVELPPLRDRLDDLPLLVAHLLKEIDPDRPRAASPDLVEQLARWHWPGNVRELRNVLERLALRSEAATIGIDDLAAEPSLRRRFRLKRAPARRLEKAERDTIVEALRFTNGNLARAAKLLGIGRATVYRKVDQFGIDVPEIRRAGRDVSS